jgi:hypothetical protein
MSKYGVGQIGNKGGHHNNKKTTEMVWSRLPSGRQPRRKLVTGKWKTESRPTQKELEDNDFIGPTKE